VKPGVTVRGRQHAQYQRQSDAYGECQDTETQRVWQRFTDHGHYRPALDQRLAEIRVSQTAEKDPILLRIRFVEPPLLFDVGDFRVCGGAGSHQVDRVSEARTRTKIRSDIPINDTNDCANRTTSWRPMCCPVC